jgi:hypothetical protein
MGDKDKTYQGCINSLKQYLVDAFNSMQVTGIVFCQVMQQIILLTTESSISSTSKKKKTRLYRVAEYKATLCGQIFFLHIPKQLHQHHCFHQLYGCSSADSEVC